MTDGLLIEVGGREFNQWLGYKADSDILIPADAFGMSVALRGSYRDRVRLKAVLAEGQSVTAYVEMNRGTPRVRRVLQHTGVLEVRHAEGTRQDSQIRCECRDLAAHLCDSNVPIKENVERSFVDLVLAYVEPWGIEVELDPTAARHIVTGQAATTSATRRERQRARAAGVPARQFSRRLMDQASESRVPIDELLGGSPAALARAEARARSDLANSLTRSDIERLRLTAARPQPSETVWEFLARHAARFGLLMWFSPEGKLIISSPDYGSDPLFRFVRRIVDDPSEPNNILSGGETTNTADRYSEVLVYGRGGGNNAARSPVRGRATDATMPFYRLMTVHDQSVKTNDEADRRAVRELHKHTKDAQVLNYELAGHSDGVHVYAPDCVVEVYDEVAAVEGLFYMSKRTFSGDRNRGPRTQVQLIPRYSFLL